MQHTPSRASEADTPSSGSRPLLCREAWARNFKIPWWKMKESLRRACDLKVRPSKSDLLDFIRKVCDEIEIIAKQPGISNLGIIAAAMVARYPSTFADELSGYGMLGDGTASLRQRLVRQFENRNRGHSLKRKLKVGFDDDANDAELDGNEASNATRRNVTVIVTRDSYGCVNWQPKDLPAGETHETQEDKRKLLLEEFRKENPNEAAVLIYMDAAYVTQRQFINGQKPCFKNNIDASVPIVLENWPFLLKSTFLGHHFEKLLGFVLHDRVEAFFNDKGSILFRYGEQSSMTVVRQAVKALASAADVLKSDVPKCIGSLLLLPGLMKETGSSLFKPYQEDGTVDEIMQNGPEYPHVAFTGRTPFASEPCAHVVIEKAIFCGPVEFSTALETMFAIYYVFNFAYPESAAATLEFIQG